MRAIESDPLSTAGTGTAPLVVNSTTKVTNLNADLLDGFSSSSFGDATLANQTAILNDDIGTSGDTESQTPSTLFAGIKGILYQVKNGYSAAFSLSGIGSAPACPSGWTDLTRRVRIDRGLFHDRHVRQQRHHQASDVLQFLQSLRRPSPVFRLRILVRAHRHGQHLSLCARSGLGHLRVSRQRRFLPSLSNLRLLERV